MISSQENIRGLIKQPETRLDKTTVYKSPDIYCQHLSEARQRQSGLLEELRQTGLIPMIENAVNVEIKPLYESGGITPPSQSPDEWAVHIPYPHSSQNGFDPTLRIDIRHIGVTQIPSDQRIRVIPSVSIHYNGDRTLQIHGEELTFSGPIPAQISDEIATALAQAFANPRRA